MTDDRDTTQRRFPLSTDAIAIIGVVIAVGVGLASMAVSISTDIRHEIRTVRAEARADREAFRAEFQADRKAFQDEIIRLTREQSWLAGMVEQIRTVQALPETH